MKLAKDTILEVKGLKKYFPIESGFFKKTTGYVKAVDNISFSIKEGETLGLVGESGCGKTTTSRVILRAMEATAGKILFRTPDDNIVDMTSLSKQELKTIRKDIQMIFQDPFSSLNPRMTVLDIVSEALRAHGWKRPACEERVRELLELVGLSPNYMRRFPHAFSGGQRQRIGIARALAINPSFVVADEAVSALDVSVQAQILNLMVDLQKQLGLTYLFIAHDLSVIRYICDRVAVMYLGKLVEQGQVDDIFNNPLHPYTSVLLSSVPAPVPGKKWLETFDDSEFDRSSENTAGCSFAPRCKYAEAICFKEEPLINNNDKHSAACHFAKELELKGVS